MEPTLLVEQPHMLAQVRSHLTSAPQAFTFLNGLVFAGTELSHSLQLGRPADEPQKRTRACNGEPPKVSKKPKMQQGEEQFALPPPASPSMSPVISPATSVSTWPSPRPCPSPSPFPSPPRTEPPSPSMGSLASPCSLAPPWPALAQSLQLCSAELECSSAPGRKGRETSDAPAMLVTPTRPQMHRKLGHFRMAMDEADRLIAQADDNKKGYVHKAQVLFQMAQSVLEDAVVACRAASGGDTKELVELMNQLDGAYDSLSSANRPKPKRPSCPGTCTLSDWVWH